jgi:hypothetical protein
MGTSTAVSTPRRVTTCGPLALYTDYADCVRTTRCALDGTVAMRISINACSTMGASSVPGCRQHFCAPFTNLYHGRASTPASY